MYPNKFEVLEELYDEACLIIQDAEDISYLSALTLVTMIIAGKEKTRFSDERLEDILELLVLEEDLEMLTNIYIKLMSKGFNEVNYPIDILLPEGIGYLIGYLINGLYYNKYFIKTLDLNLKAGTFLYSVSRFLEHRETELVGFSDNEVLARLAEALFALCSKELAIKDYVKIKDEVEQYDLLVGNLDFINLTKNDPLDAVKVLADYLTCLKEDHFFVSIIDNALIFTEQFSVLKDQVFNKSSLRAVIKFPEELFKSTSNQKSIIIGQKSTNTTDEVIAVDLPPINQETGLENVLDVINKLIYELIEED